MSSPLSVNCFGETLHRCYTVPGGNETSFKGTVPRGFSLWFFSLQLLLVPIGMSISNFCHIWVLFLSASAVMHKSRNGPKLGFTNSQLYQGAKTSSIFIKGEPRLSRIFTTREFLSNCSEHARCFAGKIIQQIDCGCSNYFMTSDSWLKKCPYLRDPD